MRFTVLGILFASLVGTALGQNRQGPYSSLGGFGSVLYPGTGHAPATPPGGINGPRFNARPGGAPSRGAIGNPIPANHLQHNRTVVVPYPVYYGGYSGYAPGYDQSGAYPPDQVGPMNSNGAPSVVINQNYIPPQANPSVQNYGPADGAPEPTMRLYQAPPSHPYADAMESARRPPVSDQPTLYLIAFKDHTIVQALGYWMENGALHYVSVEHTLNQASLDLIDRDLSQRLNDERSVEFKLPAR
jgi:hypothetical protein